MRYYKKLVSIIAAAGLLITGVFGTPISVYAAEDLSLTDSALVTEVDDIAGSEEAGDTLSDELSVSEAGSELSVSDDTLSLDGASIYEGTFEGELPYGLAGMGKDYKASSNDLFLKKEIINHDIKETLDGLTAGVDYVRDEVIFEADDEEYALKVANAYNASLVSCHDGIAVISLDAAEITVSQAVALSSDPSLPLPPVFPNYIGSLYDPVPAKEITSQDSSNAGTGNNTMHKVIDEIGWNSWGFDDPALDPGHVFYDPYSKGNRNGYQWMHDAVGSYRAWAMDFRTKGVTVAVLDTGVCENHEDLKGKVTTHHVITDGTEADYSGHGTHVAGIITSNYNNGKGGVGIAPMNVSILNVPMYTNREGGNYFDSSDFIAAINYVTNTGGTRRADIINVSGGGPIYDPLVQQAINNAYAQGVTFCAAMGNDNSNNISYPAGYDHVIAVAAVDPSFSRSAFSTYGSWADISAPGSGIFSTWNGHNYDSDSNTGNRSTDYTDYYTVWNGTSMATPVVAGACAYYMSVYGYVSPDVMEAVLKKSATKIKGQGMGAGVVNLAAMIPNDDLAPVITAQDNDNKSGSANMIPLSSLTPDSYIVFREDQKSTSGTDIYVFTVDGSKPVYKDGDLTNGYYIPSRIVNNRAGAAIKVQELIDRLGLVSGKPATLTLGRVNNLGKLSKFTSASIMVSYTPSGTPSSISIEGPVSIAAGKSAQYEANVSPAYFDKSKVEWSVTGSGVTVNPQTGKVSVLKDASDASFTLTAAMGTVSDTVTVNIVKPATGISLAPVAINEDVNAPKINGKGVYTELRMYNMDITNTAFREDVIELKGTAIGSSLTGVVYESSKPSVATVDRNTGAVLAYRPGKTKITCKATDGSGKSASININVIVPASGLSIVSKLDTPAVGYGKSTSLTAVPGNTYGKPTVSKVNWSIDKAEAFDNTKTSLGYLSQDLIKSNITIKNGKLSINSKLKNVSVGSSRPAYYKITVGAAITDGTGHKASYTMYTTRAASYLELSEDNYHIAPKKSVIAFSGEDTTSVIFLAANQVFGDPVCSSSDPKVISVKYYQPYGNGIRVYLLTAHKKGTAKLTFKTTDGSNKKASITYTVR